MNKQSVYLDQIGQFLTESDMSRYSFLYTEIQSLTEDIQTVLQRFSNPEHEERETEWFRF